MLANGDAVNRDAAFRRCLCGAAAASAAGAAGARFGRELRWIHKDAESGSRSLDIFRYAKAERLKDSVVKGAMEIESREPRSGGIYLAQRESAGSINRFFKSPGRGVAAFR
jgi:hypothetical protein